jgi:uncharacterized protein (TIGR02996 family)
VITHTYTISAYNLTPLTTALGGDFMARVGLAESEWDGVSVHDQPRPLHDVALTLPQHLPEAWTLLAAFCGLLRADMTTDPDGAPVPFSLLSDPGRRSAVKVAGKLMMALGLPVTLNRKVGYSGKLDRLEGEGPFLASIAERPRERTGWSAYADWLMEAGSIRGEIVNDWLDTSRVCPSAWGEPTKLRPGIRADDFPAAVFDRFLAECVPTFAGVLASLRDDMAGRELAALVITLNEEPFAVRPAKSGRRSTRKKS